MKRTLFRLLVFGMTGLTFSGCVTATGSNTNTQLMRQREDIRIVREQVRNIDGDVESFRMEIERLAGELDRMRAALNESNRSLGELNRRIEQVDSARAADKQQIIASLSREIEKVMKQQTAAIAASVASSSSSSGSGSGYGYEHVVQSGETISAIAKAYGVSADTIMKVNKIKDPRLLRVGQKIFIPE